MYDIFWKHRRLIVFFLPAFQYFFYFSKGSQSNNFPVHNWGIENLSLRDTMHKKNPKLLAFFGGVTQILGTANADDDEIFESAGIAVVAYFYSLTWPDPHPLVSSLFWPSMRWRKEVPSYFLLYIILCHPALQIPQPDVVGGLFMTYDDAGKDFSSFRLT